MSDKAKKTFKEQFVDILIGIKNWYLRHKMFINICLIIVLGWFIMLIIATRGFQNPASVSNRIQDGTDNEGSPLYFYNPTAISIGEFQIQWYALFIMYGIISAALLVYYEIRKKGIDTNLLWDGLLLCVPAALIGARLYFVIVNWGSGWSFLEILGWNGKTFELSGLAIHGAIIAVAIVLIPFCKFKKLNYGFLLDVVMPAFLIGQAIGRWGNFMNHELYGPMIKTEGYLNFLPNFITEQLNISKEDARIGEQYGPRHPTFLYESLFNIAGFLFVVFTRRHRVAKVGEYAIFYLIWYGIGRGALVEPLRYFGGTKLDSMLIPGTDFPINVLWSIIMVVAGVLLIIGKRLFFKKNPEPFYADYKLKKKVLLKKDSNIQNMEIEAKEEEKTND